MNFYNLSESFVVIQHVLKHTYGKKMPKRCITWFRYGKFQSSWKFQEDLRNQHSMNNYGRVRPLAGIMKGFVFVTVILQYSSCRSCSCGRLAKILLQIDMAGKTAVSILNELCQRTNMSVTYNVVSESGPSNDPVFVQSVTVFSGSQSK